MTNITPRAIRTEMQQIAERLVSCGLADDLNFPRIVKLPDGFRRVEAGDIAYASMLKKRPYSEVYEEMRDARSYAFKMLDAALIQMTYEFDRGGLLRSRLAYLPSPNLLDYENNADVYEEDSLFADVVEPHESIIPLRFDFDIRADVAKNVTHPAAHLTFGQFRTCRIATTGPLGPWLFVGFILRAFYSRGIDLLDPPLPNNSRRLMSTITTDELSHVHIGVPVTA
jgi:hypothetical protein